MTGHARWRRTRPPWWPDNQPWPPERHAFAGRRRFFRRAAIAATIVVALSVYGAFSLASMLAAAAGLITPSARGVALLLLIGAALGAAVAAVLVAAFARRVAQPIGAVMDAADRVAEPLCDAVNSHIAGKRGISKADPSKVTEGEMKAGDVLFREPLTHAAENIGDKPLHMILFELKGEKSKEAAAPH